MKLDTLHAAPTYIPEFFFRYVSPAALQLDQLSCLFFTGGKENIKVSCFFIKCKCGKVFFFWLQGAGV